MVKITLRLNLSDFLNKSHEEEVINKLEEIHNDSITYYLTLWYEEGSIAPEDLKRFKRLTSGHSIIMGRKTFESLPGALPKRHNIVVTKNKRFYAKGVTTCHSLKEAIDASGDFDSSKDSFAPSLIPGIATKGNLILSLYLFLSQAMPK